MTVSIKRLFFWGIVVLGISQKTLANADLNNELYLFNLKYLSSTEKLLLRGAFDSLNLQLAKLNNPSSYELVLSRISNNTAISVDFLTLIDSLEERIDLDYEKFNEFLNLHVQPDTDFELDKNYCLVKRVQILIVQNELLDLNRATAINESLKNYILQFPDSRARHQYLLLTMEHDILMTVIQRNLEKATLWCDSLYAQAKLFEDTTLMIYALNQRNSLKFMSDGDMQSYYNNLLQAYQLDKTRGQKSIHHSTILVNLIYVLGLMNEELNDESTLAANNEKAFGYLQELLTDKEGLEAALPMYCQFLSQKNTYAHFSNAAFSTFRVDNLREFADYSNELANVIMDGLDIFWFKKNLARLLESQGLYEEANERLYESLDKVRKVYSEDLSKSLAKYENEMLTKEKEADLKLEKTKTDLFRTATYIVSGLSLVVMSLLILAIRNSVLLRKQKNTLDKQNQLIKEQNREKELLLNEIHHRVKNNFQIMHSLMDAQAAEAKDEKFQLLARQGIQRIKVMSMVHDCLFNQNSLDINLNRYLNQLVSQLIFTFGHSINPKLDIQIPDISVKMNEGILLGLVTNELITNSFKYGFDQKAPELKVTVSPLSEEYKYELYVQDNGKDKSGIDLEKTGLGLALIKRLSRQLGGELNFIAQEGAFSLTFRVS